MAPKEVAIDMMAFLRTLGPKFMVDAKRLLRLVEEAEKRASVKTDANKLAKSLEERRRETEALRKIVRESGLVTNPPTSGPKDRKKKKRREKAKEVESEDKVLIE